MRMTNLPQLYSLGREWLSYLFENPGRARHIFPYLNDYGHSPIELRKPWLVIEAIDALENILTPDMDVFEWGSGGSTLFFADHAGDVYSVEHDLEWYRNVSSQIVESEFDCITYVYRPPETSPPENISGAADYTDNRPQYRSMYFKSYVDEIERFDNSTFDCVLVDGRARPSCIVKAIPRIVPGGLLIVDNSERPAYQSTLARLSGWERNVFYGPALSSLPFTETSIFHKPHDK